MDTSIENWNESDAKGSSLRRRMLSFNRSKVVSFIVFLLFSGTFSLIILGQKTVASALYFIVSPVVLVLLVTVSHKKANLRAVSKLLIFMLCPVAIHFLIFRDYSLSYIFHYGYSIIAGYLCYLYFQKINLNTAYYTSAIACIVFILLFSENGNTTYLNRTYYTAPLVVFWFFSAMKDYFIHKKFSWLKYTLFVFIVILSYSRSTLFPLALIPIAYLSTLKTSSPKYLALKFSALLISLFIIIGYSVQDFFSITSIGAIERVQERGFDSGRYEFWLWYLINLTPIKVLFGENTYAIWQFLGTLFKDGIRHTLHNSYLQLHSHGGIIPLAFVISMYLALIKETIRFGKSNSMDTATTYAFIGVFLVFFSKTFFETAIFPQRFDFAMMCTFMLILTKKHRITKQSPISTEGNASIISAP